LRWTCFDVPLAFAAIGGLPLFPESFVGDDFPSIYAFLFFCVVGRGGRAFHCSPDQQDPPLPSVLFSGF